MSAQSSGEALSSRPVVIATNNAHKLDELQRIWAEAGFSFQLVSVSDYPSYPEPVENAGTFEGNALIKARAAAAATGQIAVADDSGIAVDLLNGMPGVRSARWAGVGASAQASLDLLIAQLADTEFDERTARFICAMALVTPQGQEYTVEGIMSGKLVLEAVGENGFGYDPIFVTDGQTCTNGQLSASQKDALSHRGKAARALIPYLTRVLVNAE